MNRKCLLRVLLDEHDQPPLQGTIIGLKRRQRDIRNRKPTIRKTDQKQIILIRHLGGANDEDYDVTTGC